MRKKLNGIKSIPFVYLILECETNIYIVTDIRTKINNT